LSNPKDIARLGTPSSIPSKVLVTQDVNGFIQWKKIEISNEEMSVVYEELFKWKEQQNHEYGLAHISHILNNFMKNGFKLC